MIEIACLWPSDRFRPISPMLVSGLVTIGIMVAFVVYLQEFFDPVVQLSQTYTSYQSAMVGVGRIYAIIDTEGELSEDFQAPCPSAT